MQIRRIIWPTHLHSYNILISALHATNSRKRVLSRCTKFVNDQNARGNRHPTRALLRMYACEGIRLRPSSQIYRLSVDWLFETQYWAFEGGNQKRGGIVCRKRRLRFVDSTRQNRVIQMRTPPMPYTHEGNCTDEAKQNNYDAIDEWRDIIRDDIVRKERFSIQTILRLEGCFGFISSDTLAKSQNMHCDGRQYRRWTPAVGLSLLT